MHTHAIRSALLSTLGMTLVLGTGTALAQTTYRLTDLGTLAGAEWIQPAGINAAGQVAGMAMSAGANHQDITRAVLWDGTTLRDLGTLGGLTSAATAINDAGQVTGWAKTAAEHMHAFLWTDGEMEDLGTLGDGTASEGDAINASGEVTGWATTDDDSRTHPFLWTGATFQDLGTLGGVNATGYAINDYGLVTGMAYAVGGAQRAFVWNGTSLQDLGTLGGTHSEASDINASGHVTGSAQTTNGDTHAFLWNGTTLQDLGTLGGAASAGKAINDYGQVAGDAQVSDGSWHAFLRDGATMRDLGPGHSVDVNALGQVLGYTDGDASLFLWDGTGTRDLSSLIDPADPLKSFVRASPPQYSVLNDQGQFAFTGSDSRTGETHLYLATPINTGPDADGDGIAESVDANPGTPSDAFNDGAGTAGSITDRAGLEVTIEDVESPDGVRVVVGAGSGQVTLDACGFTESVAANSELIITCGSVTLNLIQGAAQVVLDDGKLTVVSVAVGATATVSDNGDGTVLVQNVGGTGVVSVTVDGTQTTIAPGGSQSYTVVYPFLGFFSPVDNAPTLNGAKAGSAIPVKFSLGGDQGLSIFALGYPKSQRISCDSPATVDAVEETVTAGSSSLSFAAVSDQYHYVWKTDRAWFGTCRQLIVTLNDSTVHVANFKFK